MKLWLKILSLSLISGGMFVFAVFYQQFLELSENSKDAPLVTEKTIQQQALNNAIPYGVILAFIVLMAGVSWNAEKLLHRKVE